MKVFIKYVLKSMTEKKGRFLLLLIAIAMSTGLVVTSTGLVDIILDSLLNPILASYEEQDLVIEPNDKGLSFFACDNLNTADIDPASIIKEINVSGIITDNIDTDDETTRSVTIRARDNSMIPLDQLTKGNLNSFQGNSCIISERIAKERNLSIGDTINMVIAGVSKDLTVVAISAPDGVFYNDTPNSFAMFLPYEYLAKEFGVEGEYNFVTAKAIDGKVDKAIESFNETNKDFNASKLFDMDTVKDQFSSFSSILYVMLLIVVAMSSIIIYSTFKLIITERLTTIGTFLSQGATTGKVKFILRLESFFYGVIGALFGTGLGILALHVITRFISPLKKYGIYEQVSIKPNYIIAGVIFAILLSLLSSYLPVRKIGKLQVKDVILNDVRVSMYVGYKKFIVGCFFIVASLLVYFLGGDLSTNLSPILLIVSLIGTILAYPKVIDLLSVFLSKLFRGKNKSLFFATNNLRTSKILLSNITLIVISILSILAITSAANSMVSVVVDAYEKLDCDIEIYNISTIRENDDQSVTDTLTKQLIDLGVKEEDINYIDSQYATIYLSDNNKNQTSVNFQGIDLDTYIKYNLYLKLDREAYKEDLDKFKADPNGIIMTTALLKGTDKKVGDTVSVECNGVKKELTIDAIIDAKLYNSGMISLVSHETMKKLFNVPSSNQITFTTDLDLDTFVKDLKPIIRSIGATFITKEDMCEQNVENNQMMMNALSIFSYLAIVIAALGIINNVSISFLQRKTEFAVLSSVGMENSLRKRVLLLESVACVTWGMVIAILYSFFGIPLLSKIMTLIGLPFEITLSIGSLPTIYIVTVIIVLLATIPTIFKSKKLSIIQELKYE
jgi:putative ABC transport system permease protein